jgi:hypothetical protein
LRAEFAFGQHHDPYDVVLEYEQVGDVPLRGAQDQVVCSGAALGSGVS